jgi:hypothetical protein
MGGGGRERARAPGGRGGGGGRGAHEALGLADGGVLGELVGGLRHRLDRRQALRVGRIFSTAVRAGRTHSLLKISRVVQS